MLTRRDFLQVASAAAAIAGGGAALAKAATHQTITQKGLLAFKPVGQVTLLHLADIHAQLTPLYFREPSINIGVADNRGLVPHVTGKDMLKRFGLTPGTPEAYAFSSEDFVALAKNYGRVGGLDRIATLVKAIKAERAGKTLVLDGGDTWQGSYTTLQARGADMVAAMNALGVDAMTGHWEFTLGEARVKELIKTLKFPFLASNIRDNEWGEKVFPATRFFERGGVKIAVIGQAFPYTPIANPRYMIPKWSFGIQEDALRANVDAARKQGAGLVVVLSHNGFDVDRKLAARVKGIDVLLTGHTHDAVPAVIRIGKTLMVSSGCHGKFLSRLDLDVANGQVRNFSFRLIPVFADAIRPDRDMAALIKKLRAPHEAELKTVLGRTESALYRRGNFNGTFDDLICDALMAERDAEIALSPGFRWGASLIPGQEITAEDVYSQTAITYPAAYRRQFTGKMLKDVLEDVADNLFNPDPYYQQGGDMVRVGGMTYQIDVKAPQGKRISDMRLIRTGEPMDAKRSYVVAGWASVNQGTKGPPVWDVVKNHIKAKKVINISGASKVKIRNG